MYLVKNLPVLFVIFIGIFNKLEGLECITCYHTKFPGDESPFPNPLGDGALDYDGSCKDGYSPDPKLSKPCKGTNSVCFKALGLIENKHYITGPATLRGCTELLSVISYSRENSTCWKDNSIAKRSTEKMTSLGRYYNGSICACAKKDCNGANFNTASFTLIASILTILIKV